MKTIILLWFVILPVGMLVHALFFPTFCCPSRVDEAKAMLRTLRTRVALFSLEHPGVCPDLDALVRTGLLENTQQRDDPCGSPIVIECTASNIRISSEGRDKETNTKDDIEVSVERLTDTQAGPK